jgi:hypothetical protein
MVRVLGFEQSRSPSRLEVIRRGDLAQFPRWRSAFANERKDYRYYGLIEDTLQGGAAVLPD